MKGIVNKIVLIIDLQENKTQLYRLINNKSALNKEITTKKKSSN